MDLHVAFTFNHLDESIREAMVTVKFCSSYNRGPSYICFTSRMDILNFKIKHSVFSNRSTLSMMEMTCDGGVVTLPLLPKNPLHNNPGHRLCMNFMKSDNVKFQVLGNRVTQSSEMIFNIQGKRYDFRYRAY